jgi:hypothetical protein
MERFESKVARVFDWFVVMCPETDIEDDEGLSARL